MVYAFILKIENITASTSIYLFKLYNGNTRTMSEVCSTSTIKTPTEWSHVFILLTLNIFTHCSGVFIIEVKQINACWLQRRKTFCIWKESSGWNLCRYYSVICGLVSLLSLELFLWMKLTSINKSIILDKDISKCFDKRWNFERVVKSSIYIFKTYDLYILLLRNESFPRLLEGIPE